MTKEEQDKVWEAIQRVPNAHALFLHLASEAPVAMPEPISIAQAEATIRTYLNIAMRVK